MENDLTSNCKENIEYTQKSAMARSAIVSRRQPEG